MASSSLSKHDAHVLAKIKNPESEPSSSALLDNSLPKDPHIVDPVQYEIVSQEEKSVVTSLQALESLAAKTGTNNCLNTDQEYNELVSKLGNLIIKYPTYASCRNNRAQALRCMFGNDILILKRKSGITSCLARDADDSERRRAAGIVLSDLESVIWLLKPQSPFDAISPQAAKTLSMAFTQRAAIFYETSKGLRYERLILGPERPEYHWTSTRFEEEASRDFELGGIYGNDFAKEMAVSINPTRKLCGQVVREAIMKEYGYGLEA